MARWTSFRVGNVKRIGDAADKKAGDRQGEVHPRVVHRLLEEGSYCDDDLMVEYLGGVLAGSRTPGGRDDRAVAWSDLVTGLSSVQIRAHYLIYRELAVLLHGRSDVQLGVDEGRIQATLVLPFSSFITPLISASSDGFDPAYDIDGLMTHVVPGLVRAGLLDDAFGFGPSDTVCGALGIAPGAVADWPLLVGVRPSFAGIELYGWAQGLPGISPSRFWQLAEPFDTDPPIPMLGGRMPTLPPPDTATESGEAPATPPS